MLRVVRASLLLVFFGSLACDDGVGLGEATTDFVLEPTVIDFGDVPVGETAVRPLKIRARFVDAEVTTIEIDGEAFVVIGALPDRVDKSGSSIQVEFRPSSAEAFESTLILTGVNTFDTDYRVMLRGRGTESGLSLVDDGERCEAGGVSFGSVARFEDVTRDVFIEASGNVPVEIVGVYLDSDTNEIGILSPTAQRHTLQPGERLALELLYVPSNNGADSGVVVIEVRDGEDLRIPLCGIGVAVQICVEPVPLNIGPVGIGATRSASLRITSCSDEPLVVSRVAIANDDTHPSDPGFGFVAPPDLQVALATGEGIDLTANFRASAVGESRGWLRIDSNDPLAPSLYVGLLADGVPPCDLELAPASLTYAGVGVGATDSRVALIINDEPVDCRIVARRIVGPDATEFSLSDTSTTTVLAAGDAELTTVTYAPRTTAAQHTATVELESEGGYVSTLELAGTSALGAGCQLDVRPNAINFGASTGGETTFRGVTIRSLTPSSCEISSAQWLPGSSGAFGVVTGLPISVAPLQNVELRVRYAPTTEGVDIGTLRLATNDTDDPQIDVSMYGQSVQPLICVAPTDIDFGPTTGVAVRTVTVTACGARPLEVSSITLSTPRDPEYDLLNVPPMPLVIDAGQTATFDVRYDTADEFADWSTVNIESNDPLRPRVVVPLMGGPDELPPELGTNLYVWQLGTVMRFPLQGGAPGVPFFGQSATPSRGCSGCHSASPDGRYVAIIELPNLVIMDTTTGLEVSHGITGASETVSWNPNVNTTPPHQFVYTDRLGVVQRGTPAGPAGALSGTTGGVYRFRMPSWGPSGQIVAARAPIGTPTAAFGFTGPVDLVLIPELGGPPVAVNGASGQSGAFYYPAWSPTGDWIAFTYSASAMTTYAAADAQIRMVRADQSGVVALLPNANAPGSSSFPTWSLDGRILSFSSQRAGGVGSWDIYGTLIDNATGASGAATIIQNVNTGGFEHLAVWSR